MSVPRGANRSSMSTVPIYTPRREETVFGIAKAQSRGLTHIKVTARIHEVLRLQRRM